MNLTLKKIVFSILCFAPVNKLLLATRPIIKRILPMRILKTLPVATDFKANSGLHDFAVFFPKATNDPIRRVCYWYGLEGYETDSVHLIDILLEDAKTYFDIGANTGLYSCYAAKHYPNLSIFSFEPHPAIRSKLEELILVNDIKNVSIFKEALSDKVGILPFYIPKMNSLPQSSSLKEGFRTDVDVINVPVTTVDNFIAEHQLKSLDVIKIDTEGADDLVISGCEKTLANFRPLIVCEILYQGLTEQKIESLIEKNNYTAYHISKNTLTHFPNLSAERHLLDMNFLLVPIERKEFVLSKCEKKGFSVK
jgi:FkbM family methyltransferase